MYFLWPKERPQEPYYFCDYRDGQCTMEMRGTFASAKPEDEIRYLETPSFRAHRLRLANPGQFY